MSEIRKTKINKRRSLPGLLPVQPSQLAGPASRRPSPPPSSVVFVLDRGRGVWPARARATAPRHLLACLPALPSSSRCPGPRHALPPALSHSPPTSSEAPPQPPLPPHRSTAPRKPCIAATSPFPSSGSDHRRRRIRRLRRVPEPANHPCSSAVSPQIVSPFSPGLSRPLGPSPTSAEISTPPTMLPSWPRSP